MVSNLRLVDPSTATNPQFPEGLEMLAFSAQQHHLPTLRRSGDIIRLHRVTVSYQPYVTFSFNALFLMLGS